MAAVDHGSSAVLFVTNVLNGTVAANGHDVEQGTVVRIGLASTASDAYRHVEPGDRHRIHRAHRPERPGRRTDRRRTRARRCPVRGRFRWNRIAAIPAALTRSTAIGGGGQTVASGKPLNDPLGLTIAPNGDILSQNGADGKIVETTPAGRTTSRTLMPNGGGDLFGLALRFRAVAASTT